MTQIDYNDVPGIRCTVQKAFLSQSPMAAKYQLDTNADKPCYAIGRLFHSWLETGGKELDGFSISPYDTYRTTEAKEWRDSEIEMGNTPVKLAEWQGVERMVKAIDLQIPPHLREIVRTATRETVYTWNGYKAQLDIDHPEATIDWKSTADVYKWERQAIDFGVLMQAYHYNMCKYESFDINDFKTDFYFAVVGKNQPNECLFFRIDKDAMEFGQRQWEECDSARVEAEERKVWHNFHQNVVMPFMLPAWATKEDK